jgi:hypothetical protein
LEGSFPRYLRFSRNLKSTLPLPRVCQKYNHEQLNIPDRPARNTVSITTHRNLTKFRISNWSSALHTHTL